MNRIIFFIAISLLTIACRPDPLSDQEIENLGGELSALPEEVIDPIDNLSTPEKISLGRVLFWDPILSGNEDVACASCHHPAFDYAERKELSLGVGAVGLSEDRSGGTLAKRNSMTILNTAFNGIDIEGIYDPALAEMFWDNRKKSLEDQALDPVRSFEEMRGHAFTEEEAVDQIVARLNAIPEYVDRFENVFDNEITGENIEKAIAAFERSLIANNSPFDRFMRGEENALSGKEKRGMGAFVEAGCINCHNGPMFSDFELHVLSVPENGQLSFSDDGAGSFEFRTASLRNLKNTGPYMHNGVFRSLDDVLEFYDDVEDGDSRNSNVSDSELDPLLRELELRDSHEDEIIAFIKALNDDSFDKSIPATVPSGLNPGGKID